MGKSHTQLRICDCAGNVACQFEKHLPCIIQLAICMRKVSLVKPCTASMCSVTAFSCIKSNKKSCNNLYYFLFVTSVFLSEWHKSFLQATSTMSTQIPCVTCAKNIIINAGFQLLHCTSINGSMTIRANNFYASCIYTKIVVHIEDSSNDIYFYQR